MLDAYIYDGLRTPIGRHAGTVLVGQLATMAFGVTDTIVAGRYSGQALAALSVGSAVYITVFVALLGVLQARPGLPGRAGRCLRRSVGADLPRRPGAAGAASS